MTVYKPRVGIILYNKLGAMVGSRCQHEPFLPAGECVAAMVGSHNFEHYFVATQDIDLRKQLRKVAFKPILSDKATVPR